MFELLVRAQSNAGRIETTSESSYCVYLKGWGLGERERYEDLFIVRIFILFSLLNHVNILLI